MSQMKVVQEKRDTFLRQARESAFALAVTDTLLLGQRLLRGELDSSEYMRALFMLVAQAFPLQTGDQDMFCGTLVPGADGGDRFVAELDKAVEAHKARYGFTHIDRDGKETYHPPESQRTGGWLETRNDRRINAENEGIPLATLERHEEIADEVLYWRPGMPIPEGYGTVPGGDKLVRVVDDEQMDDLSDDGGDGAADDTSFALDSDALILEDDEQLPAPVVETTKGLELCNGAIYVTTVGKRVVLRAASAGQAAPQFPWTSDAGYSYNNEGECFTGLGERRTGMDLASLIGYSQELPDELEGNLEEGKVYLNKQGIKVLVNWCTMPNQWGAPFRGDNGLFFHAEGTEATGNDASNLVVLYDGLSDVMGDQALPASAQEALVKTKPIGRVGDRYVTSHLRTTAEAPPVEWEKAADSVPNSVFLADNKWYQLRSNRAVQMMSIPDDGSGFIFVGRENNIRYTGNGIAEGGIEEMNVRREANMEFYNLSGLTPSVEPKVHVNQLSSVKPWEGQLKEQQFYKLFNGQTVAFKLIDVDTPFPRWVCNETQGIYDECGLCQERSTTPEAPADQPHAFETIEDHPHVLDVKHEVFGLFHGGWYLRQDGHKTQLFAHSDTDSLQRPLFYSQNSMVRWYRDGSPNHPSDKAYRILRKLELWEIPLDAPVPAFDGELRNGHQYQLMSGHLVTMSYLSPGTFRSSENVYYTPKGEYQVPDGVTNLATVFNVRCHVPDHADITLADEPIARTGQQTPPEVPAAMQDESVLLVDDEGGID